MNDDWSWKCARCQREVACVFCECCAEHCASLRPNALVAHHRRGKISMNNETDSAPRFSVPQA
jgi:hypothetical protein